MSDGAFRYFLVAVFGTAVAVRAADPPTPPEGISPTGIITNTAPLVIGSTNSPATGVTPVEEGGTNSVLTAEEQRAMEREDAAKVALKKAQEEYEEKIAAKEAKWKEATNNLGVYHVIPGKDPFRLIKPEIKKPSVAIVARPITFGVPHLAGISLLNGVRAVLRVNPPRGGKAHYVRLQEGEMLQDADGNNYGEVLKIDKDKGVVEVKVKGQTFPLEIDRTKMMASSSRSKTSSRRPTSGSSFRRPTSGSSSGRPTSGSSSGRPASGSSSRWTRGRPSSSGSSSSKSGGGSSRGSSSRPPSKSGGGLQTVPSRRRKTGSLDKMLHGEPGLYELPAFNEAVQKLIVDPLEIFSQREIIRGQLSHETPTDLPAGQR